MCLFYFGDFPGTQCTGVLCVSYLVVKELREASLKHLTLKTVFLLAMASGGRRSELTTSLSV